MRIEIELGDLHRFARTAIGYSTLESVFNHHIQKIIETKQKEATKEIEKLIGSFVAKMEEDKFSMVRRIVITDGKD